jgi:hypothetical protein
MYSYTQAHVPLCRIRMDHLYNDDWPRVLYAGATCKANKTLCVHVWVCVCTLHSAAVCGLMHEAYHHSTFLMSRLISQPPVSLFLSQALFSWARLDCNFF